MKEQKKRLYAKIVAKAWADEAYKEELTANPIAVLASEGVAIPEGVEVQVVEEFRESTDDVFYFVLPKPDEDLSAIEVCEEKVVAGLLLCFSYPTL